MRSKTDLDKLCNDIADQAEVTTLTSMECMTRSGESESLSFELAAQSRKAVVRSRELLARKRD